MLSRIFLGCLLLAPLAYANGNTVYGSLKHRRRYVDNMYGPPSESYGTFAEGFPYSDRSFRDYEEERHDYYSDSKPNGNTDCRHSGPKIPNFIQPMQLDVFRELGKWYTYLRWSRGPTGVVGNNFPVNQVLYITKMSNLTNDPSTDTAALVVESLISGRERVTKTCQAQAVLAYLTEKGEYKATIFDGYTGGSSNTAIAGFPGLILSSDHDTYSLVYFCAMYNYDTGLCQVPDIGVFTRTRPDQIDSDTADYIAAQANRALNKYCLDASMMTRIEWLPQLSECPVLRPSDTCYLDLLLGMLYLAGNDDVYDQIVKQFSP